MKHEILPAISSKKASNIRLLIVEIRLHFRFHFIHFILKSNNKTIHRPARACTCTFSGFSQSKQTSLFLMSLMTLTWPFFRTLSIDNCATKSTISGREVINHSRLTRMAFMVCLHNRTLLWVSTGCLRITFFQNTGCFRTKGFRDILYFRICLQTFSNF